MLHYLPRRKFHSRQPRVIRCLRLARHVTGIDPDSIRTLHNWIHYSKQSAILRLISSVHVRLSVSKINSSHTVFVGRNSHCVFLSVPTHVFTHALAMGSPVLPFTSLIFIVCARATLLDDAKTKSASRCAARLRGMDGTDQYGAETCVVSLPWSGLTGHIPSQYHIGTAGESLARELPVAVSAVRLPHLRANLRRCDVPARRPARPSHYSQVVHSCAPKRAISHANPAVNAAIGRTLARNRPPRQNGAGNILPLINYFIFSNAYAIITVMNAANRLRELRRRQFTASSRSNRDGAIRNAPKPLAPIKIVGSNREKSEVFQRKPDRRSPQISNRQFAD